MEMRRSVPPSGRDFRRAAEDGRISMGNLYYYPSTSCFPDKISLSSAVES